MYLWLTLPAHYLGQEVLSVSTTQNDKVQVHFIFGENNFIPVLEGCDLWFLYLIYMFSTYLWEME